MNDVGFVVAVKNIGNTLKQMWEFCCNAWNIITDPTQILIGAMDLTYWILLITAMVCLILTMAGCKKTKNGATISIIIYTILQCIASVLV
ncbi:hypothetical protein QOZ83_16905 [Romboutsia sedimentorum]|uniref:hypothetical protein n=1 Tax=Romboutsia sedimentorum TaxID=1368474 RepID=UPI0024DED46E|nr:hypothetical protein [Romboutsia sedimentorum]MDK2587520.1 hypothetical protein [Romboutsia sedimentorum]